MDSGFGSGDEQDNISDPNNQRNNKKKRYHRHSPHQIQELESIFKECPHPDEKQRLQLSRDLGLETRQIKFWFQNRRTQMKAQHERADNSSLRHENDKIRCENIAIREALKRIICPSCGSPEDSYFDEQKLRMENSHLKGEVDRVSSICSKYIGRPISRLPSIQPIASSLDLSVGSYSHGMSGGAATLDLDLSSSIAPLPFQAMAITDMEKSLMTEIANAAMDELIRLLQAGEPMWIKSPIDGRETLNIETYESFFPRVNNAKRLDVRTEASRDSGVVIIDGLQLVDIFLDSNKWIEMFPTIAADARTIEILTPGMPGSRSGSLQLMYEVMQVLSPLVPTREFYFLRHCQQIQQGLWAIADVSFDVSRDNQPTSPSVTRKRPSGCLIEEMPNGYCKVTWIEHVEVEEQAPCHRLYRDLINRGVAFGAERRLAVLQRVCERFASHLVSNANQDPVGVIPSPDGRRSMMKLAQRMINSLCASICASNTNHRWTSLTGDNDTGVRVSFHKGTDPGQPNGVICSATTSIWLPVSAQNVFDFFKDERNRPQWDVLSDGNPVQEVAHISNGAHPNNCISVLRSINASQNNMLILQESCTDPSGSMVVYSPVDLPSVNIAMAGEDPSFVPILPSGFIVCSDGRRTVQGGASTSSNIQGSSGTGSLVTVAFQILVSSLPTAKLNFESIGTVSNLINTTVHQIKNALNCPGS